jgi:hypothetical protein
MGSYYTKERIPPFQMIFKSVHVDGFNLYVQCPVCVDGRQCSEIVMPLKKYVDEGYGFPVGIDDDRTWIGCRYHERMIAEKCYKNAPRQKENY